MKFYSLLTLACAVGMACPLIAQQVPVHPASTHIFPAGGQRGTDVALRVGGECLPPHPRLRWFTEGLSSPQHLGDQLATRGEPSLRRKPTELPIQYPKEWQSSVAISSHATLGPHLWRLSSASGGTGGRYFVVGELPEFIETESNSAPHRAESITLPITINGQLAGERDLDYYAFTAQTGDVVTAEVVAARLGYPTETLVEFFAAEGERLPSDEMRLGSDPVVAVKIPSTGRYHLVVSNLTYHGGPQYVYRITVSTAAAVKSAFPAGWQAGQPRIFTLSLLTGDGSRREVQQQLTLDNGLRGQLRSHSPPAGFSALRLESGIDPEIVEAEPNTAEQPMRLSTFDPNAESAALTINGQFSAADDEDVFEFAAKAGTALSIDCAAAPHGAATLPVLSLQDAAGTVLATRTIDDPLDRRVRLDPWSPPADGVYRIRLRDLRYGSTGGPDLTYRLRIARAQPDYELLLANDFVNVVQGARAELDVRLRRKGGFTGPVRLSVDNLPAGVVVDPLELAAGQDTGKISFFAAADARSADCPVRITGSGEINGANQVRTAQASHLAHDAEGVAIGPSTVDHVQLTVVHKPVFKLYCNEAYQYAHRGTIYPYLMEVERLDGFAEPIVLEVADRQIKDLDGIEVLRTTIAADASIVMLPIFLPETMHINVQAHSNIYAQGYVVFNDQWGQRQSMLVVSTMRCMIRPLPTVARLTALDEELICEPGSSATCRLHFERTANFSGPVTIELLSTDPAVRAEPVVLPADATTIAVPVHTNSVASGRLEATLVFRAVGHMPQDVRLVSQASVQLRSPSAQRP